MKEQSLIVQILSHTPAFVYALFVALLVFGLIQTRTRTVGKIPAMLLPAGMIVLSLVDISASFGFTPLPLAVWGIALTVATITGYVFFREERIHYRATEAEFFIPGSWSPLAVMMAIFFTKYIYAVMRAFDFELIATPMFVATLCAIYGLFSGYFSSRAVNLLAQAQKL